MKKVIQYTSNIAKSLKFATIDVLKDYNPSITEFAETNAELFKEINSVIRNRKAVIKNIQDKFKSSKIYAAADAGVKNVFDDIKNGTFYNKAREESVQSQAMGMGFDEFDMGDFDSDSSFNWDLNDEDPLDSTSNVTQGDVMISSTIGKHSQINASVISNAIMSSSDYIVQSSRKDNQVNLMHQIQAFGQMNTSLGNITNTINSMLPNVAQTLATHAKNSTIYYEKANKYFDETTGLLKELVAMERNRYGKELEKEKTSNRITYSDIVGAGGIPDIKSYGKKVGQNVKNEFSSLSGGIFDIINNMDGDDGNMLLSLVANPFGSMTKGAVKKVLGKTIETSMNKLNQSFQNFFGAMILKLNTMAKTEADEEDGLLGMIKQGIGKIFGVNIETKTSLDTSKYKKDKVDWDGKSRLALIEVIPTYLRKILAAITNKDEHVFDYDKGKFIKGGDVRKQYDDMIMSEYKGASSEVKSDITEMVQKNVHFSSKKDSDTFYKELENLLVSYSKNKRAVNINKKYIDEDLSIRNEISEPNYRMFIKFFKRLDRHKQMAFLANINTSSMNITDKTNRMEQEGDSLYNSLFRDFGLDKSDYKDDKKYQGGIQSFDSYGYNSLDYLRNINDILIQGIKTVVINGGTGRSGINNSEVKSILNRKNLDNKNVSSTVSLETENRNEEYYKERNSEQRRKDLSKGIVKVDYDRIKDTPYKDDNPLGEATLESILDANMNYEDQQKAIKEQQNSLWHRMGREGRKKFDAYTEKNKGRNNFFDKLIGTNAGEKYQMFNENIGSFLNKPTSLITNVLDKVDKRLYEMIFGYDEEEYGGKKISGLMEKFTMGIKDTFDKVNEFLDDHIFSKIRNKLDEHGGVKGILNNFLEPFGIDLDDINIFKKAKNYLFGDNKTGKIGAFDGLFTQLKSDLKGMFGIVKGAYKESVTWVGNKLNISNDQLKSNYNFTGTDAEQDESGKIARILKAEMRRNTSLPEMGFINNFTDKFVDENMEGLAEGTKYVRKDGIYKLSKGEAVISADENPNNPETKKKYNRVRDLETRIRNLQNKLDTRKLIDGESSDDIPTDKAIELLTYKKRIYETLGDKAKVSEIETEILGLRFEQDEYRKGIKRQQNQKTSGVIGNLYNQAIKSGNREEADKYKRMSYHAILKDKELNGEEISEDDLNKYKLTSLEKQEFYKINKMANGKKFTFFDQMAEAAVSGMSEVMTTLFGSQKEKKELPAKVQGVVDDIAGNYKEYMPKAGSGALIGAGASLLTGAIGGPLLGAAVGASYALIKNSNKFQEYLFGSEFGDQTEEGKSKKGTGLFDKKTVESLEKHLPDLGKWGLTGGVTGFLMGNPILGIMAGSAFGFLKNTETFKGMLFGEDGIFGGEENKEKLKKALPSMGLGSIAGVMTLGGPFGLLGSALIGATAGYATQTDKFKDFFFGKENENGEREGGLLRNISTEIFQPMKEFAKYASQKTREWFVDKVVFPMKGVKDTVLTGVKSMFQRVGDVLGKAAEGTILGPIVKFIGWTFNKLKGLPGMIIKGAGKVGGEIASLPFRGIGRLSDRFKANRLQNEKSYFRKNMTQDQKINAIVKEQVRMLKRGKNEPQKLYSYEYLESIGVTQDQINQLAQDEFNRLETYAGRKEKQEIDPTKREKIVEESKRKMSLIEKITFEEQEKHTKILEEVRDYFKLWIDSHKDINTNSSQSGEVDIQSDSKESSQSGFMRSVIQQRIKGYNTPKNHIFRRTGYTDYFLGRKEKQYQKFLKDYNINEKDFSREDFANDDLRTKRTKYEKYTKKHSYSKSWFTIDKYDAEIEKEKTEKDNKRSARYAKVNNFMDTISEMNQEKRDEKLAKRRAKLPTLTPSEMSYSYLMKDNRSKIKDINDNERKNMTMSDWWSDKIKDPMKEIMGHFTSNIQIGFKAFFSKLGDMTNNIGNWLKFWWNESGPGKWISDGMQKVKNVGTWVKSLFTGMGEGMVNSENPFARILGKAFESIGNFFTKNKFGKLLGGALKLPFNLLAHPIKTIGKGADALKRITLDGLSDKFARNRANNLQNEDSWSSRFMSREQKIQEVLKAQMKAKKGGKEQDLYSQDYINNLLGPGESLDNLVNNESKKEAQIQRNKSIEAQKKNMTKAEASTFTELAKHTDLQEKMNDQLEKLNNTVEKGIGEVDGDKNYKDKNGSSTDTGTYDLPTPYGNVKFTDGKMVVDQNSKQYSEMLQDEEKIRKNKLNDDNEKKNIAEGKTEKKSFLGGLLDFVFKHPLITGIGAALLGMSTGLFDIKGLLGGIGDLVKNIIKGTGKVVTGATGFLNGEYSTNRTNAEGELVENSQGKGAVYSLGASLAKTGLKKVSKGLNAAANFTTDWFTKRATNLATKATAKGVKEAGIDLAGYYGKEATERLAAKAGKDVLLKNTIKEAGDKATNKVLTNIGSEAAQASAKSGRNMFVKGIQAIIDWAKKFPAFTKFANKMQGIFEKIILKPLEKAKGKMLGMVDNILAKLPVKMAAGVTKGLLFFVQASTAIWAGVSGASAGETANLFRVSQDSITPGMRVVSAALKVLLDLSPGGLPIGPLLDIANELSSILLETPFIDNMAIEFYKHFLNEDDKKAFEIKQENFEKRYQSYLLENNLTEEGFSRDAFNDQENKSFGSKIGDVFKGNKQTQDKAENAKITAEAEKEIRDLESRQNTIGLTKEEQKDLERKRALVAVENLKNKNKFGYGKSGKSKKSISIGNHFSQKDVAWGNIRYNNPGDKTYQTLSDSGCAPVSGAMFVNELLGTNINPANAAEFALKHGFKDKDGGTRIGFFDKFSNNYGIDTEQIDINGQNKKDIINNLQQNKPVILLGQSNRDKSVYGKNSHYVVAKRMTRDGKVIASDPNENTEKLYTIEQLLNEANYAVKVKDNRIKKSRKAKRGSGFGAVNDAITFFRELGKMFSSNGNNDETSSPNSYNSSSSSSSSMSNIPDIIGDNYAGSDKYFLSLPGISSISSPYNVPRTFSDGNSDIHGGIDYVGPYGTVIRTPVSGTVADMIRWNGSEKGIGALGNLVKVKDRDNYYHYFAHLQKFNNKLNKGQSIKENEIIGEMGSTGYSTGSHLHYAVRQNDNKNLQTDPDAYMKQYFKKYGSTAYNYQNPQNYSSKNNKDIQQAAYGKEDIHGIGGEVSKNKTDENLTVLKDILLEIRNVVINTGLVHKIIDILEGITGVKISEDTKNKIKTNPSMASKASNLLQKYSGNKGQDVNSAQLAQIMNEISAI